MYISGCIAICQLAVFHLLQLHGIPCEYHIRRNGSAYGRFLNLGTTLELETSLLCGTDLCILD